MKKICDVCGKRAEGLGTCPTQFHDIIMCSSCYEGLRAFEKGRSVKTVQELEDKRLLAMSEMQEKAYPSRVIENVDAWFAERKQKLIENILNKFDKLNSIRQEKEKQDFNPVPLSR